MNNIKPKIRSWKNVFKLFVLLSRSQRPIPDRVFLRVPVVTKPCEKKMKKLINDFLKEQDR